MGGRHRQKYEVCRLQNSRIFCERERRSIFKRKVWSESKNGEREWGETLKNTTVRHPYIKFVQNYPFFQQREIPIGLILTQPVIKCQSHLIKKIQTIQSLASDVGFVLKSGQKEAVESLLKGRDVFGVLPMGFRKSLIFPLFVLAKNGASNSPNASVERPTIIVICPLKSIMEEQITSNEFGLSAAELRFDGETLNSIRNGEVQVVYATADEQVLKEQFTTLLKEDCPFRRAI